MLVHRSLLHQSLFFVTLCIIAITIIILFLGNVGHLAAVTVCKVKNQLDIRTRLWSLAN